MKSHYYIQDIYVYMEEKYGIPPQIMSTVCCGLLGVVMGWQRLILNNVISLALGRPIDGPGAIRADSRFAPRQWETALLCNDVSHWLSASLGSALAIESILQVSTMEKANQTRETFTEYTVVTGVFFNQDISEIGIANYSMDK